ncbi:pilus assembly protein PilV [Candidatus Pelagibacter sp.]|nr:pilus assembly protein PilV [Candidatus Pelagibacter sp.]
MNKNKKISGLSLLEALVSTAIVGIGFVAILQMTNYSVQSIYSSGERTKANYLTNMIAEDVIGHKNVVTGSARNFSDYLFENEFNSDFCEGAAAATGGSTNAATGGSTNIGNVYGNDEIDGPLMKQRKWQALLNNKNYLNCKGGNERRNFRVFKLGSKWSAEPNILENDNTRDVDGTEVPYIKDDLMYVGRVQMNLNDGKKRKYLYFQTDYVLKP